MTNNPQAIDEIETEEDLPLSTRIKNLAPSCQFDLLSFYKENKGLVKKYIRKNTTSIVIENNVDDIPGSWWYKNQEGILRTGLKKYRKFSDLEKLEWIKCGVDVIYFTKKYIKITTVDDGIQPFNLRDYQEDVLRLYDANRFVISMQARQTGKTQVAAAYIIHFSIFNEAKVSGILAQKSGQAQEVVERIQLSYELMPMFLQPGVRVYNKQTIVFGNSSKIFSAASSATSVRGKSLALLYIDEVAFIPNDMKFYESTYPTIASGKHTKVILTSTPNGMRGLFYKMWSESITGSNDFKHILVTWNMVPGRDEEWKRLTIANSSKEQFRQEHDCVFRGSSNSLINGETLEQLVIKQPIKVSENKDTKIYHEPIKGHEYIITVDVSRGLGQDYHAFTIIDITEQPHEVAVTYKNNILSSLILPTLIYNAAKKYNDAHILVELNDIGEQVANILFYDLEPENLITTVKSKGGNGQTIGFAYNSFKGVKTSTTVKSVGCMNAKSFIENDKINLNDEGLINEFGTMVPHGRSYAADDGSNDDQAMTIVLYAWAMTQPYFMDLTNQDARKKLLQAVKASEMDELMPFGIISSDVDDNFDGSGNSGFFSFGDDESSGGGYDGAIPGNVPYVDGAENKSESSESIFSGF